MSLDSKIFDGKTFSDLLKNIYSNQKKKDRQIISLIADLRPYVTNIDEAATIVPLIRDYMEISVKNDEQLVKMAAVVQRIFSNSGGEDGEGGSMMLSDEEKEELIRNVRQIGSELESPNTEKLNEVIKSKTVKSEDESRPTEDKS